MKVARCERFKTRKKRLGTEEAATPHGFQAAQRESKRYKTLLPRLFSISIPLAYAMDPPTLVPPPPFVLPTITQAKTLRPPKTGRTLAPFPPPSFLLFLDHSHSSYCFFFSLLLPLAPFSHLFCPPSPPFESITPIIVNNREKT